MDNNVPEIAFLGISERANSIIQAYSFQYKNVLGLRDTVFSSIFPLPLDGFNFVFAIYDPVNLLPSKIKFVNRDNKELFCFDFCIQKPNINENLSLSKSELDMYIQSEYPIWALCFFPLHNKSVFVAKPEQYKVVLCRNEIDIPIGCLNFGYAKAMELSEERVAAIKSNPAAVKAARFIIQCNKCLEKLSVYTSIERNKVEEDIGMIWYKDLPDVYKCKCGANTLPMKYLKESMHALIGQIPFSNNTISFTRLYENEALNNICTRFEALLNEEPLEERIQEFIERFPILLQQFAAEEVFFKLPILSKCITDICIINNKNELLLIEIEKPNTRILRKDGGIASELQHAFDQVRDWLHIVDEHRNAALDCFNVKSERISSIRGIVIAGRDRHCDSKHLRKLKWTDFGKISFYTYDDILNGLISLIRSIKSM